MIIITQRCESTQSRMRLTNVELFDSVLYFCAYSYLAISTPLTDLAITTTSSRNLPRLFCYILANQHRPRVITPQNH